MYIVSLSVRWSISRLESFTVVESRDLPQAEAK
jgi:hypothetical protein